LTYKQFVPHIVVYVDGLQALVFSQVGAGGHSYIWHPFEVLQFFIEQT